MKITLKERFKNIDLLDTSEPLLERIGGLYYLGNSLDQPETQEKLKDVLTHVDEKDPKSIQLCLHAAILLAQIGNFEGVGYLLHLLRSNLDKSSLSLVETALRNCSQFPFAVLLALAFDSSELVRENENLQELMSLSDDDLYELGQQPDYLSTLESFTQNLEGLKALKQKSGYCISIGTILSIPLRSDRGFRYTGFIIVNKSNGCYIAVPYDMGDILNRNDQRARQDIWQLLRRPGRRVLVVHQENPPFEAQLLYILPFPTIQGQQMNNLLENLARGCTGLELGLVAEVRVNRKGDYRIITTNGSTRVMGFHKDDQSIGNLFLGHQSNSQFLSTRYKFTEDQASIIVNEFIKNTQLEKAVYLRSHLNKHYYGGSFGNIVIKFGDISTGTIQFVDQFLNKEGKVSLSPFSVAGDCNSAEERASILERFFKQRPEALGAVLQVYENEGNLYARIVHAQSKQVFRPLVVPGVRNGQLVYCEIGDDGRLYTNILQDYYLSGGCPNCYGTGSCLCTRCNVTGRVTCTYCYGSSYIICPECNGKKLTVCGHCDGRGEKEVDCHFCDGSGNCKGCGGTGQRAIGICNRCNGTGTYGYSTCLKCGGDGKFKVPDKWCGGTGKCNKCDGTGVRTVPCRTCNQTGEWGCGTCHERGTVPCSCDHGKITCPDCHGDRVSDCNCLGKLPSKILATQ